MKILVLLVFILHSSAGQGSLVGGWTDVDPNKLMEEWKSGSSMFGLAVDDIFRDLVNRQNTAKHIVLHRIVEAEQQLVNGMNYKVTLELGHTECWRNNLAAVEPGSCNIDRIQTCKVKAYRSFQGKTSINQFNCGELVRAKRHVQGSGHDGKGEGLSTAKRAAEFATQVLNSQSYDFYRLSLHSIEKYDIVQAPSSFLDSLDSLPFPSAIPPFPLENALTYSMEVELLAESCQEKAKKVDQCRGGETIEEVMTCRFKVVEHLVGFKLELVEHACDSIAKSHGRLFFKERQKYEEGSYKLRVERLQAMPVETAFQVFKTEYGKTYSSEEEERKRMKIFAGNLEKAKFYQDHDSGTATYGASPLSDLTEEEFRSLYMTKEWDPNVTGKNMRKAVIPTLSDLPKEFDWRNHDAVSSVKNQMACGSCWAFCVVGNIEGAWAIKHRQLFNLSAQELVDCDQVDEGCNGGLPSLAYDELQRIGGLEVEEEYPYKGKEGVCEFSSDKVKVTIKGSLNISSDENDMAAWMVENGPIAIGINALAMQFYLGGISHPWSILCPKAANHGVVIVGYGVKKGWILDTPYWIIKNSWGSRWGEHGYYLVYRGGGVCGLNLMASSAIVE